MVIQYASALSDHLQVQLMNFGLFCLYAVHIWEDVRFMTVAKIFRRELPNRALARCYTALI